MPRAGAVTGRIGFEVVQTAAWAHAFESPTAHRAAKSAGHFSRAEGEDIPTAPLLLRQRTCPQIIRHAPEPLGAGGFLHAELFHRREADVDLLRAAGMGRGRRGRFALLQQVRRRCGHRLADVLEAFLGRLPVRRDEGELQPAAVVFAVLEPDQHLIALEQSSQGWHEGKHNPWPFINYALWILKEAYKEFEQRIGQTAEPAGAKAQLVREAVQRQRGNFSVADLERTCPGVGRDWIRQILRKMKAAGELRSSGHGAGARWERV